MTNFTVSGVVRIWREEGGTKRHRNNASHTRTITPNRGQLYTVLQKKSDILFYFFNKMKNSLILITVVRKILNTFDTKDCLHTVIATKCGRKK